MINFFYNTDSFKLNNEEKLTNWINKCITHHNFEEGEVSYTFMSDEDLLSINKEVLNHDFYTDIITIDQSIDDIISGDIFISIDRVQENAKKYNQDFEQELLRVLIHGVLHIIGFDDHNDNDKKEMRKEEDYCIKQFF